MKIPSLNKNLKIIIIGFGSIGQRHYRNLRHLGLQNIYVYDIDQKKVKSQKSKVKNLDLETLKMFNAAFICNPTNLHIKTAILCAEAGCHLFIEKPLSYNLQGIQRLIELCRRKKLVNLVGCNIRFHPCISFIKKYLEAGRLGKIYSMSFEGAYFLPYWRPGEDYRKNYAARKATGGGIILDGIHEFDLLFWFNDYHEVTESKFIFEKVSNLKIETEDICFATFLFANKVLGLVKCDYLQKAYSRNCKIVGEAGTLEWDYQENMVWLKNERGSRKLFEVKNYDINNFYVEEMKYFLDCVQNKRPTFNQIHDAYKVLKYCVERK